MPELTPQSTTPSPALPVLALSRSTPPTTPPPPPSGPAAVPPRIDPDRWEHFVAFRETFLIYFSEPRHNAALRAVVDLVYEMTLEYSHHFPEQPEGWRRAELRAAVADLRHLQGYLATLGQDPPDEPYEAALCSMSILLSGEVGSVAERIEAKLGDWRGEGPAS
ncbi:MAG TPA: hypothetical protein VLX28_23965 [Thermoanaerobaculia bacterium]|nr:hypothetical protein [Thermoanaerobaculia bacterium]